MAVVVLGRFDAPSPVTAGGGSSKASCRDAILEPSWPLMSVDDAGVGSCARGILMVWGLRLPAVVCDTRMSGEDKEVEGPTTRMARAQLLMG